tara:strand:- start:68 stop:337 length:270 start_codon:yes stop_codon:yes gene_type:complete
MLPLIYIGYISFISSFTISHCITREYLRHTLESEIGNSKKNSKVKFNTEVRFKLITPVSNISSETLDKLWYKKEDYEKFKNDFKRYNSI